MTTRSHTPRVLALLIAAAILVASCGREESRGPVTPILHNSACDIWPDSIDLHNGVTMAVTADSLMIVRRNGNAAADTLAAPPPREGAMTFISGIPVLDFFYRLEASTAPHERYSLCTPYEIYLNPLQREPAMALLRSHLHNDLVVPQEVHRMGWPLINCNGEWLLAASELANATGDRHWLSTVRRVARQVVDNDMSMSFNHTTGLFCGIPPYMAANSGIFPKWMQPSDIFAQCTSGVNVAYCAALHNLEKRWNGGAYASQPPESIYLRMQSDSLLHTLKRRMWLPNLGCLSALSYGVPYCQTQLSVTDNLAQGIAVLSGILPDAMAGAIVSKTPVAQEGAELFHPQLPELRGSVTSPVPQMLLLSLRALAAARTGNEAAYSEAIGALMQGEARRLAASGKRKPAFGSTFTSLITRGLLGMQFMPDGVFFAPYVPENLPGDKQISGLRYRDAILDIHITGTGRAISTFTLDGKPADTFLPASLTGRHTIRITLAGASADPGKVTYQQGTPVAPPPPVVHWQSLRRATLAPGIPFSETDSATATEESRPHGNDDGSYLAYLNGILSEEILSPNYRLYNARRAVVVQLSYLADSRYSGFSAAPYIYAPPSSNFILYASSLAKTGTKILEDHTLASKFVESDRSKNRNISFTFFAPREGRYLVQLRYVSGLGVVNSQRRLALRQLRVGGHTAAVLMFPQLTGSDVAAGAARSWQEMTAWTNAPVVTLQKGENHLQLRYFQASPVYADPTANAILFDQIRIIPID